MGVDPGLVATGFGVLEADGGGVTVRDDRVLRVLGRDHPEVDDGWLCDRGRFAYQSIHVDERVTRPMIRDGGKGPNVTATLKHNGTSFFTSSSPTLSASDSACARRSRSSSARSTPIPASATPPLASLSASRS